MKSSIVSDETMVNQREGNGSAAFSDWKYDAFISYRHRNPSKPIAERLQRLLETYVPPKELHLDLNRKLHLFRDEAELPTSNDLGSDIKTALEQSRFLIVICTPDYEESKWCMEEISYFKSLHNGSNRQILTLAITDPDQPPVFPETLCYEPVTEVLPDGTVLTKQEEIEPLSANVSAETMRQSMKKLKTEFLRIAAPILGCGFDDLYQREQRRRTQRKLAVALSTAGAMTVAAALSAIALITINTQRTQIAADAKELRRGNTELLLRESDLLKSGGDLYGALRSAVQACRSQADGETSPNGAIERIASLTGAYEPTFFTAAAKIELPERIKDLCLLDGGSRLMIATANEVSLWDTQNVKQIQRYEAVPRNFAFYRNRSIDRSDVSYYAKGSLQAVSKDGMYYYDMYRKDICEERQSAENAVFMINESEDTVQRISLADGSAAWSVNLKYPSFLVNDVRSDEGIVVRDTNQLVVLDPDSGSVIAQSENKEIEAQLSFELSKVDDCCYANDHLILYSCSDSIHKLAVFRRENDALILEYCKDVIKDHQSGRTTLMLRDQTILFSAVFYDEFITSTAYFAGFDLDSGEKRWEYSEDVASAAEPFVGFIPEDKGAFNGFPAAFAVVGSQLFAVNAKTGDLISAESLQNDVKELYCSENGFVFVISETGKEYFFTLRRMEEFPWELRLQLNHEFYTDIGCTSYLNNTYAAAQKDSAAVSLYYPFTNEAKTTVYQYDNEDSALSGDMVSPDGGTAVVYLVDEKESAVIDLQTNEVLCLIPDEGNSLDPRSYLGEDYLILGCEAGLRIYEAASGRCLQELSKQSYDLRDAQVYAQYGAVLTLDSDEENLLLIRPGMGPEQLAALKQLDAGDPDDLSFSSIEAFSLSLSGEKVLIQVRHYQGGQPHGELFLYDRETQNLSCLEDNLSVTTLGWNACSWAEDDSAVYLLYGSTVCGYDSESGEQLCRCEPSGMKPVDLIAIGTDPCVLDVAGTITRYVLENGELTAAASFSTGSSYVSSGRLSIERHGDHQLFLRLLNTGWRFDEEQFQPVYQISRFSGVSDATNLIYTKYYDCFYAYPIFTADEIAARGESFLKNE